MEPTPETSEALAGMTRYGDTQVEDELVRIGRQARELVPEIVGVSLGILGERLTFTLVADGALAQELDAMQYVDDGPCLEAVRRGELVAADVDTLLNEDCWAMFARASAVRGVKSSLSLPVLSQGQVVVGVNLYASTPTAFDGHHEQLAAICQAWAPGAVTNADLAFSSRREAAATPGRLRDQSLVDQATGMLAEAQHLEISIASDRITEAAARAGITESQAAQTVIRVLSAG